MTARTNVETILDSLVDQLAAIEHERWSHWQRYMHSKGVKQADGSLILPADLIERWERQAATSFDDLSAIEKDSDREQVARYLPLIASTLSSRS